MKRRLEIEMIPPIRSLMQQEMNLDVISEEFSAGYGIADLVGASLSKKNCQRRERLGLSTPLDNHHILEILLLLTTRGRTSISFLLGRISFSESTLRRKVLPQMITLGLIKRDLDGRIYLVNEPPEPARYIVAVEAKQTRWRDAILQARRYTFFANCTYIAVWNGTAELVDRQLLYRHRLGLIGVEPDGAEIILEAPSRKPRKPKMHRYCAEFLYGKILSSEFLPNS